jgi:hypothetical protein
VDPVLDLPLVQYATVLFQGPFAAAPVTHMLKVAQLFACAQQVHPSRSDPARTQHEIPGMQAGEMGDNSEVFMLLNLFGEKKGSNCFRKHDKGMIFFQIMKILLIQC